VISPSLDPTPAADPTPSLEPTPSPEPTPDPAEELPGTTPLPLPAGAGLAVSQVSAGRLAGPAAGVEFLAPGAPLLGVPRFATFRLRFEVVNGGTEAIDWTPALRFAVAGGATLLLVPAGESAPGWPFYAAPEWVRLTGGGTAIGPSSAVISSAGQPDGGGQPAGGVVWVDGIRSMGLNPLPPIGLPPFSTMVVEFSVRPTVDAAFGAAYDFALSDAGTILAGELRARVVIGERPPLLLSPGQRTGVPPEDAPRRLAYRLNALGSETVHSPSFSLASDACAACHRAHTAVGGSLTAAPTQLGLCSTCHNGVDAPDVAGSYADVPANDPSARAYYQHDPMQTSGALGARNDCADCHDPHDATAAPAAAGAAGWTASGRIAGVSGVAVTNGGAGGPTYALVNRTQLEYQLCFKCHSGYAALPDNAGQPLSRYALDKGVEFDPGNASYHPIEAPGTNTSDQLNASLAASGTSPYKQWAFTTGSTIRCVNCHADGRLLDAALAAGTTLPADASLPLHASPERGILLAPYQDRALNGPLETYRAADFALCYLCHAEAPFVDVSGSVRDDTSFRYHGLHVSSPTLQDHGSVGTSIDTPGDGAGLATCAECHFRIHSSAYALAGQTGNTRLVNFAPNVTATSAGAFSWQARSAAAGSCTLRCHGQPHATDY
jgi:predicted CXXCH cytochrome family protein